jgi:restriction system protein
LIAQPKKTRPVWLVRAGKHGGDEADALEYGLAIIGYSGVPDLSSASTFDEILAIVREAKPEDSMSRIRNWSSQLASFALRMQEGDIVAVPLKTRSGRVALGRVKGPYSYRDIRGAKRHTREVDWIRSDVLRSDINQDLLYSLGAFMTVCRIRRNEAEARFSEILQGNPDPGFAEAAEKDNQGTGATEEEAVVDIAQVAQDQIQSRLRERFVGHDLARLVEAVLQADGYKTELSLPGPDGGVDILAGRGPLGLDGATLCVQVKSQAKPADVNVFRALQGTMQTFKADRGLLVCWGGFTRAAEQEARQHHFRIRLWDASDLVEAIDRVYDKLPEGIQTDLPLRHIWALVLQDED